LSRLIHILCICAITIASVQNRGELWVMAARDCAIRPEPPKSTCDSKPFACSERKARKQAESGCCSSQESEPATPPVKTCNATEAFPGGDLSCPNPTERSRCRRLLHSLWADIPHKAALSQQDLAAVSVPSADTKCQSVQRIISFSLDRPWGIHHTIATTVLRI
jgi:hypothetical protein